MTRHELKTHPHPFEELLQGRKTFEYRVDDRGFDVGDELLLRLWDPDDGYQGAEQLRTVTHIMRAPRFGLPKGYVVMSLAQPVTHSADIKVAAIRVLASGPVTYQSNEGTRCHYCSGRAFDHRESGLPIIVHGVNCAWAQLRKVTP